MQDFYWDSYHIVREQAPHWLFLMHDSFHFDVGIWGDFMKNCPTIGLDTHIYQVKSIIVGFFVLVFVFFLPIFFSSPLFSLSLPVVTQIQGDIQ